LSSQQATIFIRAAPKETSKPASGVI